MSISNQWYRNRNTSTNLSIWSILTSRNSSDSAPGKLHRRNSMMKLIALSSINCENWAMILIVYYRIDLLLKDHFKNLSFRFYDEYYFGESFSRNTKTHSISFICLFNIAWSHHYFSWITILFLSSILPVYAGHSSHLYVVCILLLQHRIIPSSSG